MHSPACQYTLLCTNVCYTVYYVFSCVPVYTIRCIDIYSLYISVYSPVQCRGRQAPMAAVYFRVLFPRGFERGRVALTSGVLALMPCGVMSCGVMFSGCVCMVCAPLQRLYTVLYALPSHYTHSFPHLPPLLPLPSRYGNQPPHFPNRKSNNRAVSQSGNSASRPKFAAIRTRSGDLATRDACQGVLEVFIGAVLSPYIAIYTPYTPHTPPHTPPCLRARTIWPPGSWSAHRWRR